MATATPGTNTLPGWNATAPTTATGTQQTTAPVQMNPTAPVQMNPTAPIMKTLSILSTVNQGHLCNGVQYVRFQSAVSTGAAYEYKPYKTDEILCNLTLHVKFQTDGTICTDLYYKPGTPQGRRHIFNRKNFTFIVHLRDKKQGLALCLSEKELELDSAGYRPPHSHSPWFHGGKINYQELWQNGFDDSDDSEDNVYLTYSFSLTEV